jgi:hypothetical protein
VRDADEAVGDLAQQPVADLVAERVVDGLEPVEVDEQQCCVGAGRGVPLDRLLDVPAEVGAVRQAGQLVVPRLVLEPFGEQPVLCEQVTVLPQGGELPRRDQAQQDDGAAQDPPIGASPVPARRRRPGARTRRPTRRRAGR